MAMLVPGLRVLPLPLALPLPFLPLPGESRRSFLLDGAPFVPFGEDLLTTSTLESLSLPALSRFALPDGVPASHGDHQ